MKFNNALLGLTVSLFASSATALSLGEAYGQVVLGKPIDLIFDVYTDPGMALDIACVQASVQAGETQIDHSRLRITALPVVAGRPPSMRIRSSVAVVEPIVSMRLSVGCAGVVVRNYDFFAEAPPALAASALPLVIAPAPAVPPQRIAAQNTAPAPSVASYRTPPSVLAAKSEKQDRQDKPVQEPPALEAKAATAAAPVALVPVASAPVAPAVPETLGAAPASAAATPLNPSSSPPQELLQEELPQEITDTPAVQVAAQPEIEPEAPPKSQPQPQPQPQPQQQPPELDAAPDSSKETQTTLALLGAMCVLLVLLGWRWQRKRTHNAVAAQSALDESYVDILQSPGAAQTPLPTAALPLATEAVAALALAPADMPLSAPPTARMLHPEELFDLQQQAEFFISVGEHDQAIAVMKKHIDENVTASPLMYLELLRLYRSLSRRDDFSQLRTQFQQHFNALVPEFSAFQNGGRTLLDYPETTARIEALWSDDAVQPLLESCIFCPAEGCSNEFEPFELPAYDDLLLLYAIANTIPAKARGEPPPRQRTTPYAEVALMPPQMALPPVETLALSAPLAPLDSLGAPDASAAFAALEQDLLSPAPPPAADEGLSFDFGAFLDAPPSAVTPDNHAVPTNTATDLHLDLSLGLNLELEPASAPALPPLSHLMEYDAYSLSDEEPGGSATELTPYAVGQVEELDFDLSEMTFLEAADLPASATTSAPVAGQPISFGAISGGTK